MARSLPLIVIASLTLGIATFSYLPYAFFNMASPLLAIAFAYLGIRMFRTSPKPTETVAQQESTAEHHP